MPQLDLYAFYEQVSVLLISFSIFYFFNLKVLIASFIRTISLRKNLNSYAYNLEYKKSTFSKII
jgi:hypothetical protein